MPQPDATEPLGFVLTDAARLLRAAVDRALEQAGLGLTPGDARILAVLDLLGPVRQTTLAARLALEPMTVLAHVDRLEKRGLVERLPDAEDRRAKLIRRTAAAADDLATLRPLITAVRREALRDFTPEEAETLHALLLRLRARLAADEAVR